MRLYKDQIRNDSILIHKHSKWKQIACFEIGVAKNGKFSKLFSTEHIAVSLLSDMDGEITADYRNPKKLKKMASVHPGCGTTQKIESIFAPLVYNSV